MKSISASLARMADHSIASGTDPDEVWPGSPPVTDGPWIRPSTSFPAEPRWGHLDGLQLGIAPLRGPRGLLRIYAPYLGHDRMRLVNFVAVEPVPAGSTARGLSELEQSSLDPVPGKRFWSADDPSDATPADPQRPARGVVDLDADGVARLTVYVLVEPFDNGADVYVRVRFRADRPHEVALAAFRREGSAELAACVLTATMGNYARLRRLHLAQRTVTPAELWPGFTGTGFADHARFPLGELRRDGDAAIVTATPDEIDLGAVRYSDDTKEHWKYTGTRAVQGWRADEPAEALAVLVNARWAYWASSSPIPGGPSYENFELYEPFRQGAEYRFSVEPMEPEPPIP
jgi:hypothetical protein